MKHDQHKRQGVDYLFRFKDSLVVNIPDNFDVVMIEQIEDQVLNYLHGDSSLKVLVLAMQAVETVDRLDLERLAQCLSAVRLLGRKIGLCGITPGLAALITSIGLRLPYQSTGHDLKDILKEL